MSYCVLVRLFHKMLKMDRYIIQINLFLPRLTVPVHTTSRVTQKDKDLSASSADQQPLVAIVSDERYLLFLIF